MHYRLQSPAMIGRYNLQLNAACQCLCALLVLPSDEAEWRIKSECKHLRYAICSFAYISAYLTCTAQRRRVSRTTDMGFSDSTALVALIVSLIALFIALLQLISSLFGTAEGYKRCAHSVIGAWEGLRRRYFHMSEFRFEVKWVLTLSCHKLHATPRNMHSYNIGIDI